MTSRTSFSLEKLRSYLGMALAVAAGGALGALLRWTLTTGWTSAPGTIAWSVLLINVVGSALLGVVTVVAACRLPHRPMVVAFLGTGLLGGFTTFSTVMVLSLQLAYEGHPWVASLQVLLNVLLSVLAAVVAMFCTTLAVDKQDAKRGMSTELSVESEESAEELLAVDRVEDEEDDPAAEASGADVSDAEPLESYELESDELHADVVAANVPEPETTVAAPPVEATEVVEIAEVAEAPVEEHHPAEDALNKDPQHDDAELFTESNDAEELLAVDRAHHINHPKRDYRASRDYQAKAAAVPAAEHDAPADLPTSRCTYRAGGATTSAQHEEMVPGYVTAPPAASPAPAVDVSTDVAAAPGAATDVAAAPGAASDVAAAPALTPRAGRHSHAKPRPLMANGQPEPELYLPDLDFDSEAFAFPGTAEFPIVTFDEGGEGASRHSRRAVPEGQAGTVADLAARFAAARGIENEEDK